MRVLLQRVSRAEVRVGSRVTGSIGAGFLLLVGFAPHDAGERIAGDGGTADPLSRDGGTPDPLARDGGTPDPLSWMADKIHGLRLFNDKDDKMNLALADVGGAVLVVSQFTLYGDASKGRRPSFIDAARPEVAIPLYEKFISLLRERGLRVETGEFGAMMDVELVNDGPVTLWLEK